MFRFLKCKIFKKKKGLKINEIQIRINDRKKRHKKKKLKIKQKNQKIKNER